jgi:23S rRNA (uridine2552-2'-O)-methyltransferase
MSKAWMREHVTDPYVRQAKAQGYRSRAAFKLDQLARRDKLLRPGMTVVDLGAAPGGWSQVAAQSVGPKGRVIAVDILEMPSIVGVEFIHGDLGEESTLHRLEQALSGRSADLVLSDMAPNISGIAMVDQARAARLAEVALDFALKWLKPGGNLLVKTFHGEAYENLRQRLRVHFRQVVTCKPDASRSRSPEVYLLGRELVAPGRTAAA